MSPELENTVIDPASFLSDAGITEPQSVPPENPPKDKEPKDKEPKDEKGKQFAEQNGFDMILKILNVILIEIM